MNIPNIPSSGAHSVPESAFHEWMLGALPERDFHAITAAWVAANLWKYPLAGYPVMPQSLSQYVAHRMDDSSDHDESLNRKLGQWVALTHRASEENQSNHGLLVWCEQKCSGVALTGEAAKLRAAIDRYGALEFPHVDFGRAVRVQAMDAMARERRRRVS